MYSVDLFTIANHHITYYLFVFMQSKVYKEVASRVIAKVQMLKL